MENVQSINEGGSVRRIVEWEPDGRKPKGNPRKR